MPKKLRDPNVRIELDGTSFTGIYDVVGDQLELTSPNFGEGVASISDASPQVVAERLLRSMAEKAMQKSDVPFMPDNDTA